MEAHTVTDQASAIKALAEWYRRRSHAFHECRCLVDCPEYKWATQEYLRLMRANVAAIANRQAGVSVEGDIDCAILYTHQTIESLVAGAKEGTTDAQT